MTFLHLILNTMQIININIYYKKKYWLNPLNLITLLLRMRASIIIYHTVKKGGRDSFQMITGQLCFPQYSPNN